MFVDFKEVSVVDNRMNGVFDIVGFLRIVGDKCIEPVIAAVGRVRGGAARWVVNIIGGQKAQQLANHREAVGVIGRDEVRDAAGGVVGHGSAKLLLGDFFVRDSLDDIGPGDEHVG